MHLSRRSAKGSDATVEVDNQSVPDYLKYVTFLVEGVSSPLPIIVHCFTLFFFLHRGALSSPSRISDASQTWRASSSAASGPNPAYSMFYH